MASKLYFQIPELLPILDHAEKAPKQGVDFGQLMDKKLWKPGTVAPNGYCKAEDIDQSKLVPQVLFVKDSGAYIMSAGEPRQLREGCEKASVVSYASGCNPNTDEDFYDNARILCGGDDFGHAIPASMIRATLANKPDAKRLCITLGKRTMSFTAR